MGPPPSLLNSLSIKTPREEPEKVLATRDGETGSGPKFAGEEDKFFIEGIEEVLAQWEPEVGTMPPVNKQQLELSKPNSLGRIKTPSKKQMLDLVMASAEESDEEESDLDASMEPPSFGGVDDMVFLDGLEEVVPDEDEEGSTRPNANPKSTLDVLTPHEIPVVAVSDGHIKAPKLGEIVTGEENAMAEGPQYSGPDDATFHGGVEEVVAEWPNEKLFGDKSEDVEDTFFMDGLEEVQPSGPSDSEVGVMPALYDIAKLSISDRPAPIRTQSGKLAMASAVAASAAEESVDSPYKEPEWSPDDDTMFLDKGDLVEDAVNNALNASTSQRPPLPQVNLPVAGLKINTESRKSGTLTPATTPTCGSAGSLPSELKCAISVNEALHAKSRGPLRGTPYNTPADSECTNSPDLSRTASLSLADVNGAM